ncbi:hypothetical protein [Anditalea andensis]|uniref:DUF4168 domain-containing protein n=1 Tax=Anditalea andensis TaxID=1048983 RepID=A0A074KYG2_9BACT|nr:hypothetical protein [Anditalea andensis]KEO73999.1 hypothetical protein EL17_07560 [Anditalea andensis]
MKRLFVLAIMMAGLLNLNAIAQETAAPSDEITEEELEKFAMMEDSVMSFYESKNAELVDMIKNNEAIDGAGRYNEIKAAWGNEEKMEAANITAEEQAAYQEILDFTESLADEVRTLKTDLIMDKDFLGASTYNKINKAMKEDPAVKERVDSKIAELKDQRENDNELADGVGR